MNRADHGLASKPSYNLNGHHTKEGLILLAIIIIIELLLSGCRKTQEVCSLCMHNYGNRKNIIAYFTHAAVQNHDTLFLSLLFLVA